MPSLFNCPSCGKQCWNLKPYLDKETAEAIYGCSEFLVEGKYCPHCGKYLPSYAPPAEVYQKRLKEEKDGK
jgi:hypothetical protein